LFQDKISIRAIVIDANKIWYAAERSIWFYNMDNNQNLKAVLAKTL
jgi:hypothetical protein